MTRAWFPHRDRRLPAWVLILAMISAFSTVACTSVAVAGGVDPLIRPQVISILKSLGVLEDDGTYAGGGGVSNPATANLSMGGNDLVDVDQIEADGIAVNGNISATGRIYAGLSVGRDGGPSWAVDGAAMRLNNADLDLNGNMVVGGLTVDGDVSISGGTTEVGALNVNGTAVICDAGDTCTIGASTTTVSGITSATVSAQVVDYAAATTLSLTEAQCKGQVYRLTGSALQTINLPDAGASIDGNEPGLLVTFLCENTAGVKLQLGTGDSLTTTAGTSASAGYVHSSRSGSLITITRTTATAFYATQTTGTWRFDSTTSAGWAYTDLPPTAWTPTSTTWSANVTFTGTYTQRGCWITSQAKVALSGTPTTATLTIGNWAGGFSPSTSRNLQITDLTNDYQIYYVGSAADASGGANSTRQCVAAYNGDGKVYFFTGAGSSTVSGITQASPWAWANNDSIVVVGTYAVDP